MTESSTALLTTSLHWWAPGLSFQRHRTQILSISMQALRSTSTKICCRPIVKRTVYWIYWVIVEAWWTSWFSSAQSLSIRFRFMQLDQLLPPSWCLYYHLMPKKTRRRNQVGKINLRLGSNIWQSLETTQMIQRKKDLFKLTLERLAK